MNVHDSFVMPGIDPVGPIHPAGATPNPATLVTLLEEQARIRPYEVAAVFGPDVLTFAELLERSRTLASVLRGLGVAPDDRIGLFLEPSLELVVGVWGVLCAQGAYLPLSPEYPDERLRYMVEDGRVRIILTQQDLRDQLAQIAPAGTRTVVLPGDAVGAGGQGNIATPGPRASENDLAYIIYTSGSIGKPKGVMIEHRAIVHQMRWLRDVQGIGPGAVVLHKTPMSFDAAQWEVLAPACGARVVVGGAGIYRDPDRLIGLIAEHGVTDLQCVPTLLQALVATDEFVACDSLRQIFCGGEALSVDLARRTLAAMPGRRLVNLYGPTECTINASWHTAAEADLVGTGSVPIGVPVPGVSMYVLGPELVPVADGEVGELYIGGVQLARGYLDRPELTAERFLDNPFRAQDGHARLYRTGDAASRNADGTFRFLGRTDNQVKVRGYRVELDEVRLPIEAHDWVRAAAVAVRPDPHTGSDVLVAFVELDPAEAALMDQGNHGAHHQSKASKLQVRAQLSGAGRRSAAELAGHPLVVLPGAEATAEQRRRAFARKTYRFYEGGAVTRADILGMLAPGAGNQVSIALGAVAFEDFGAVLRFFEPFHSPERLLPKYGYASPGSLYATQMYLEIDGMFGLEAGLYYHDPAEHRLVLLGHRASAGAASVKIHLIGRNDAIEPVYKNNIQEVLQFEAGHMAGLFDAVLPGYGLALRTAAGDPRIKDEAGCAPEDFYLCAFDIVAAHDADGTSALDIYVQSHTGRIADLPGGLYKLHGGDLVAVGPEIVQKKHVIAINQEVYHRASFGVALVDAGRRGWSSYVALGRELQRLQTNGLGLGLMSAGYSSETGNPLPAARRLDAVLADAGLASGASYFAVGGKVSPAQISGEGMKEDTVHMRGPAEMIRDELAATLPHYMIPNRVVVVDRLPQTANGKIDLKALPNLEEAAGRHADRPFLAPRSRTEQRIAALWGKAMSRDTVSVHDDFFASGGNSLIAVALINRLNREFDSSLPLQILFTAPTVEKLAEALEERQEPSPTSRLVLLHTGAPGRPVYSWPGLGGYTMNLRQLARRAGLGRPVYGIQAHGINPGEKPFATIREMAAADVAAIRRNQPQGPYTLWGYSFGARVAFEAAHQLEAMGQRVDRLVLIAPGSPRTQHLDTAGVAGARDARTAEGLEAEAASRDASFDNPEFLAILFSVFAGTLTGPLLHECLRTVHDPDGFAAFIAANFPELDADLVRRVIAVVQQTFEFQYTFRELTERRVLAPITVIKARGDDYSFLDGATGHLAVPPAVVELDADHYSLLKEPAVGDLAREIRRPVPVSSPSPMEAAVPHVSIKHFSTTPLPEDNAPGLVADLTKAITAAFGCDEGVVSISIEAVPEEDWHEQVYVPEIVNRKQLLRKTPNY